MAAAKVTADADPSVIAWRRLPFDAAIVRELRAIASKSRPAAGTRGGAQHILLVGGHSADRLAAAKAISGDLRAPLLEVDLSAVTGKYIGETEKNIGRLFDDAHKAGAVLFFDEADALFGRRGDVSDANDRYANIEASHILNRIEAYCGIAILSTNSPPAERRAAARWILRAVDLS